MTLNGSRLGRPRFESLITPDSKGDTSSISSATSVENPNVATPQPNPTVTPPKPWWQFVKEADDSEIKKRFVDELKVILDESGKCLETYVPLAILSPKDSIDSYESDRIFEALMEFNKDKKKNVLLFILTPGGSIEPAYQISTLCKAYSKDKFVVVVPRKAKSAGTLIAIGADEIHMGPLSQLGPIDPQLGGLPALAVVQAVERIASLAQKFPGSSDMFAKYLNLTLTVEQIGYCERISESAVQYATRLLETKPLLKSQANKIANELVYEYKDHGFVIDLHEAQLNLGTTCVRTNSPELKLGDEIYQLFEDVNLFLDLSQRKRIALIGLVSNEPLIFKERN